MNLKSLGLALAAGIATFLIVTVAVTELLAPRIYFSIFVGIPAGLLAGAAAAALVALGVADDAPAQRRRLARSFAAFAAVFLGVLVVGGLTTVGVVILIVAGVLLGTLVAVATYVRGGDGSGADRLA